MTRPASLSPAGVLGDHRQLVFTQIANTAISMEGKAWWMLKAAPISGVELLRGKFTGRCCPSPCSAPCCCWSPAIWKGFSLFGLLYGWIGIELLGAGMLVVSLGFAVPWAKLDWDNPKQMPSGWGWLITTVTQYRGDRRGPVPSRPPGGGSVGARLVRAQLCGGPAGRRRHHRRRRRRRIADRPQLLAQRGRSLTQRPRLFSGRNPASTEDGSGISIFRISRAHASCMTKETCPA